MFSPVVNATAVLVGTIVGAGIFALPEAGARAGLPVTLAWLFGLTVLMLFVHLMYGEVVMRTPGQHRLPGYARLYLGSIGARWALASAVLGSIGVLLIYVVLADMFLTSLLPFSLPEGTWGVLAWAVFVVLIASGIRTVARIELVMTALLVALMALIVITASPRVALENLTFVPPAGNFTLPYGVLIFALFGITGIPEMRDLLDVNAKGFRKAIMAGTLLPAVLYAVFLLAVVGAFGDAAKADITVVVSMLGPSVLGALTLFGVLAVTTSFLVLGAYFVDTLRYDLHVRRRWALTALAVPLVLFLAGARDFTALVAFLGTVLGLVDGLLLLRIWQRVQERHLPAPVFRVSIPRQGAYVMMGAFVIGTLFSFGQSFTELF